MLKRLILSIGVIFIVGGCGLISKNVAPQRLDLGSTIPENICTTNHPSVMLMPIAVAPQYTGTFFIWRKEEGGIPNAYAEHLWIAPTGALMQQLMQLCLAKNATPLVRAQASNVQLQVHIDRMEHLFQQDKSYAVLDLRAELLQQGKVVAQKRIATKQIADSNPAAGSIAMRAAALQAMDSLTIWLAETL